VTNGRVSLVLLALGRDPLPAALTQAVPRWDAEGVSLSVVTLTPRARLAASAPQVALLPRPVGPGGVDLSTTGAPRSTVRKALRRLHLDPLRWAAAPLFLASSRARRLVAGADVVLAADAASLLLGWVLARRRREDTVLRSVAGVDRALGRAAQP